LNSPLFLLDRPNAILRAERKAPLEWSLPGRYNIFPFPQCSVVRYNFPPDQFRAFFGRRLLGCRFFTFSYRQLCSRTILTGTVCKLGYTLLIWSSLETIVLPPRRCRYTFRPLLRYVFFPLQFPSPLAAFYFTSQHASSFGYDNGGSSFPTPPLLYPRSPPKFFFPSFPDPNSASFCRVFFTNRHLPVRLICHPSRGLVQEPFWVPAGRTLVFFSLPDGFVPGEGLSFLDWEASTLYGIFSEFPFSKCSVDWLFSRL